MTFNWLSNLKFAAQPRRRTPRRQLSAIESLQSRLLKSATSGALASETADQDGSDRFSIDAIDGALRITAMEPGHHFSATVLDGNLIISVDGNQEFETPANDISLVQFTGSAGEDAFDGSEVTGHIRFRLNGRAGNDLLSGGTSRDTINGGMGDDVIFGGAGNDQLRGGTGDDVIDAGAGRDRVFGGSGDDSLNGGAGADRLRGGQNNDILVDDSRTEAPGRSPSNVLIGGEGEDVLASNGERDRLRGGSGADTVASDDNAQTPGLTESDFAYPTDDPAVLDEVLRKLSGNSGGLNSDDASAPQIAIDVTIKDSAGNEISRVVEGEEFQIHISARDVRPDAIKPGVFSAYFDLVYETEFIDVISVKHHSGLRNSGTVQDSEGLINEAGAINRAFLSDDSVIPGAPFKILTANAVATRATGSNERITIRTRKADLPFNNITAVSGGQTGADLTENTFFGFAGLSIVKSSANTQIIQILSRVRNNATPTNAAGIINSLPDNAEVIDESATIEVEFFGSLPSGTADSPESFFFNIPYESALLKLASSVEIGPSFETVGDGPFDNQAGLISGVAGKLSGTGLKAGEKVLLARARFQVRPEVGVPVDVVLKGLAPQASFAPVAIDFRTVDGTPAEASVGPPAEVTILPIAFDVNDDGAVSFNDLAAVLAHSAGTEVSSNRDELKILDFNQDEIIDRRDINLLLDQFLTRNNGVPNRATTSSSAIATNTAARQAPVSQQAVSIASSQLINDAFSQMINDAFVAFSDLAD